MFRVIEEYMGIEFADMSKTIYDEEKDEMLDVINYLKDEIDNLEYEI